MKTCAYIGCCVDNPFGSTEELVEVIDKAKEITKETFVKKCIIEEDNLYFTMEEVFNDINICFYEYTGNNETIYFYVNSCIEYFYKDIN